jgi:hypothetical protein
MAVQYYFDNLDPTTFQRLINGLLSARYGEDFRFSPLRGKDGGRDAETAPLTKPVQVDVKTSPLWPFRGHLNPGRYFFQVKHHRMADRQPSAIRTIVIEEFERELMTNVLNRDSSDRVNYFFLVTNVPASKEAISRVDEKRKELLINTHDLHADVLWQEQIVAWLDQSPHVWNSFPELFAGMKVPVLGQVADTATSEGLPRSVKIAITAQSARDSVVPANQP